MRINDLEAALVRASAAVGAGGVLRCDECRLGVAEFPWQFQIEKATAIDAHWQRRQVESPTMFNGEIYLASALAVTADAQQRAVLEASFFRTDFKSYLYWRETGFPPTGVRDVFGSALIRSAEGHVLLGRQRPGNVNKAAAYLPGGFIDTRDVTGERVVDIDASIARELGEETGLGRADVDLQPGYLATFDGALVSIAREVVSRLPAQALRARIMAHIEQDPSSELIDAVIVHPASDLDAFGLAPYARRLLAWLFAERGT